MYNRYYKGTRECGGCYRGIFSFLTESVLNLLDLYTEHPEEPFFYYHDLTKIKNFGNINIFDICFNQDFDDFISNKNLYKNIENIKSVHNISPYSTLSDLTNETRDRTEFIIKKHFILKDYLQMDLEIIQKSIDFTKTLGVHRRNTDISIHHPPAKLETIFEEIDKADHEKIFLLCDNLKEFNLFTEKYGEKIITFDTYKSKNENLPFFRSEPNHQEMNKHIIEMVFGVLTLGKCNMLICGKSNLSAFSILSNKNLKFKIL